MSEKLAAKPTVFTDEQVRLKLFTAVTVVFVVAAIFGEAEVFYFTRAWNPSLPSSIAIIVVTLINYFVFQSTWNLTRALFITSFSQLVCFSLGLFALGRLRSNPIALPHLRICSPWQN